MKKFLRKLSLTKTTLKSLQADLSHARGGVTDDNTCMCSARRVDGCVDRWEH